MTGVRKLNSAEQTPTLAVKVKNVCLTYGSGASANYVLNGINLNVPKGGIYGLLGPSGCGKTSLLSIIVGIKKAEFGQVSLFGYQPGSKESGVPGPGVGFMPQDIALQHQLTIEEMMRFFGRLYDLEDGYLEDQINYLIQLFELPEKTRFIGNLSGGQQRRVSLACTILHKPRLAILDEPTVGVDPMLCKKIWNLLVSFSKNDKMTIIITTHYIEETKQSDLIGFMRKGQILAEDSPTALMRKFEVNSLERVFYCLCTMQKQRKSIVAQKDISRRRSVMDADLNKSIFSDRRALEPYRKGQINRDNAFTYLLMIQALIWKYLIETVRQPGATLIMFIFPSVVLGLLSVTIGGTPFDIKVGWFDEGRRSDFMNTNLITTDNIVNNNITNITSADYDPDLFEDVQVRTNYPYLPDMLRDSLDKKIINLIDYDNLDKAKYDIKKGKIWGVIHLTKNFSYGYLQRDMFFADSDKWVANESVIEGAINLYGDYSQKFIYITISLSIQNSLIEFRNNIARKLDISITQIKLPFDIPEFIYGGYVSGDYFGVRDFAAPGFVFGLTYLVANIISMLSVASELNDNMYVRTYIAGLSAFQLIIGQIIARFVFLAVSTIVLFCSSIYVFGIPCKGSIFVALGLLFMATLSGMTHGMVMGILIPDLITSTFVGMATLLYIFFVSGLFWPYESLPYYMNWFSVTQPFTLPTQAFRSILIKENAPFHPLIWSGFIISGGWFIIFLIITIILLKRTT